MANELGRNRVGPLSVRIESGRLVTPNDVASKIENMELTTEGTLRSIDGPMPYVPAYAINNKAGYTPGPAIPAVAYEDMHGVYHCLLEGGSRDVLLVHSGSRIMVHQGWSTATPYETLLGPASVSPTLIAPIATDSKPKFPTQFESTPDGVVIVPQDTRAYFYDGYIVAPLGYSVSEVPGPPQAKGPNSLGADATTPNSAGYSHHGGNATFSAVTSPTIINGSNYMQSEYGTCRLGSTRKSDVITRGNNSKKNILGGILDTGAWRAATQFVDMWGNLSPLSPSSADVTLDAMENIDGNIAGMYFSDPGVDAVSIDSFRFQVAWSGIDTGPDRTVARKVLRTKDVVRNTNEFYEVPPNAGGGFFQFATMPDNLSNIFPDNTPDTWLLQEATLVDPVPQFKLCRMAFGRLWIANFEGNAGAIRFSLPGKWGTFPKDEVLIPDAHSSEITGLWSVAKGLLVFTESSTFLFSENDSGDGFVGATLHPSVGCVAPSSLGTLSDGTTIWLGQKGFYAYSSTQKGMSITPISVDIQPTIKRINVARRLQSVAAVDKVMGEYRCWVPHDGSTRNNLCLVFDGSGWRQRSDVQAASVCTTKDHRNYQLAAGRATPSGGSPSPGLWLLGRSSLEYTVQAREAVIETAWLKALRSRERSTLLTAFIWLRATRKADLVVEAMRDWRKVPVIETTASASHPPKLYSEDDVPPFWNEAILGSGDVWEKRRPFWVKVDFHLPSCEVFKLRLKYEGDWEFLGFVFEDRDVHGGGVQVPP